MKERVLTAIVLLAVVGGALFFDPTGWAVKVLILAVAGICGFELGKITGLGNKSSFVAVVVGLCIFFPTNRDNWPLFLSVSAVVSVSLLLISVQKDFITGKYLTGIWWIVATTLPMFVLASTKSPATWPLLMTAAIPIWCGDTAAIFVGKAFGKHKLAPSISPNKTWEGSIGNLLACVGAALALGAIFHYPMLLMVLLGLNCGILGQAGDLFESWLKRKADVKDSGNILPGHGGLLDRLDSLMATAPFSLLILQSLIVPGKP